ncbi:MAG: hypothetical protein E7338_04375 [Clostridiales bacterium]|nr:hypothetical protein [Clostridiales bacterium]
MKKRVYLVLIAIILIVSLCLTIFACKKDDTKQEFASQKVVYASTWKEVKLSTTEKNWRDGMVGGNGKTGFITNGSPSSDVITYQNIDYLMPTSANREDFPQEGVDLDTLRQKIVNKQEPTDSDVPGNWDRISKFHPGMQLRIDTKYSTDIESYSKFTNYETAEVGETFTAGGATWTRKTFTSRIDNVTITSISNSSSNVTLSISIDTISKMAGFGKGSDGSQTDETNILYREIVENNAEYLAQIGHYPDYEYSYLKNGGFGAVSLVIANGGTKKAVKKSSSDSYNTSGYDASIDIEGANSVYIITALDRTKSMGTMAEFETQENFELLNTLLQKTKDVSNKYGSGSFSYDAALAPSAAEQNALFNAASLDITAFDDSEAALTNEELIAAQKKAKTLSNALANRVYNQGRYAMICCAGYSMSRLSGMWIGTWDPGWRYIYTMDANVNLQSSGMNTSNLSTFGDGYIRFVYNQIEDWETNAKEIYGIDNAILCPPHADGDRALNDEGNIGYPFRYWNAGAAWMIQPIYEYYQCYGDAVISTLDGDKTLLRDVLLPLLQKNANFWLGLCTPKYYTDASGNACYSATKTALNADEKYLIVPSYSPENWTVDGYSSTLAVNCAMDISAAKYSLEMAIEIENLLKQDGYSARIDSYRDLLNKLPNYQYNDDGSIKEWCANGYNDNNEHRHFSHLYYAWPAFEMQGNETLINGAKKAIEDREKASSIEQSKQSHCWLHKGLVLARLKDSEGVTNCLFTMLSSSNAFAQFGTTGLLYSSLMTNHDITGTSNAYCTDSSLGLIGIMNEALLYSNNGEIEVLPALPTTWTKGEYKTLRARCRADVSCKWNGTSVSCTIKSDIDQTIKVSYKGNSQEVTFAAGETKTFNF